MSLTRSFSGSLETASGDGVTSRAANWATASLTQILHAKAELTGSSLDICHVHLPLAAPFPCAAGEAGMLDEEGSFWQRLHNQSLDAFNSTRQAAQPRNGEAVQSVCIVLFLTPLILE